MGVPLKPETCGLQTAEVEEACPPLDHQELDQCLGGKQLRSSRDWELPMPGTHCRPREGRGVPSQRGSSRDR